MTRGTYRPDRTSGERFIRWRGGDVSRLEGLADAVFALALTLLVVRLEVPQTFAEVRHALVRAPVYMACFGIFLWVWFCHYQFHRRYGLDGPLTVAIDGAILFVVLLFALPLRFVADLLYSSMTGAGVAVLDPEGRVVLDAAGAARPSFVAGDGPLLMAFYAGGFALLFGLLALQTWNALQRRDRLALDALEVAVTRGTLRAHLLSAGLGLAALLVAVLGGRHGWLAGFTFFLLGPGHFVLGYTQGRRLERLEREVGGGSAG